MNGEEVLYVGQTGQTLGERATSHRSDSNGCGSKNIPSEIPWEITLLEECEEDHATDWERFYIEMLAPPYNKKIPGRTKAEWQKVFYQSESEKANKTARQNTFRQTEAGKAYRRRESKKYREKKLLAASSV